MNHKKILPFLFLFVITALYLSAKEIDVKSGSLEYDEESGYAVAKDSVTVSWEESILKADKVDFYIRSKKLSAENNVSLKNPSNVLYGKKLNYDYGKETGEIENVSGAAGPWFFTAKKAVKISSNTYTLKSVNMTSCDFDEPDYRIKATTAKVKVGKRITSYNPVLYFRKIPVFYLPIYVHATGDHKDSLEVEPGYNNTDGFMCKVIYGYPLAEHSYGKLYLDWYGRRGWGKGAEYIYTNPETSLDIYGYHIREKNTDSERYNFSTSYWQRLNPLWTAQARAEFMSDSSIVNNYFQDSWYGSAQKLHSFFAATRQGSKSNLRVITERYDIYQPVFGSYDPFQITIPRIEYTLYPQKIKKFYYGLSGNIQYQYLLADDYYTTSGQIDNNITKDYRITRKTTFKPTLGITENWQDRTSRYDLTDIFVTRYYTNLNLRHRLKSWIHWDFGYGYRIRSKVNKFEQDFDAVDYGRENNQLSFANSMYLGRFTIRNTIGYNLLINRGEVVNDWREKFTPQVNEVTWSPPKNFYVYFREENKVYPWGINSAQAYFNWGRVEKRYFNFGVFYQSYYPDNLDFATGIGFWPTRKIRLDYSIRTTSVNRFSSYIINDQEIKLFRNIHCWEFKISYRRRLDNEEIYFGFGLNTSSSLGRGGRQVFNPW